MRDFLVSEAGMNYRLETFQKKNVQNLLTFLTKYLQNLTKLTNQSLLVLKRYLEFSLKFKGGNGENHVYRNKLMVEVYGARQ